MNLLAETVLPGWASWVLGAAAVVTALGVLWNKVARPGMKLANNADEMLPLLRELTLVFRDNPTAFKVLDEIVMQFRTDSGSSLRDVVNRLDAAAIENARVSADNAAQSKLLAVAVEATKQLAERDRQEVQRLFLHLDRVATKVDTSLGAIGEIQRKAGLVAVDLAESHARADAVVNGPPGAAADAASQESRP